MKKISIMIMIMVMFLNFPLSIEVNAYEDIYDASDSYEGEAIVYNDTYIDDKGVHFTSKEVVDIVINDCEISKNKISFDAIVNSKKIEITADIIDDEIMNLKDQGDYKVCSINIISGITRFVLKDINSDQIIYVNLKMDNFDYEIYYNRFWYNDLLNEAGVEVEENDCDDCVERNLNNLEYASTGHSSKKFREISREYQIYDEYFKEILKVCTNNKWPNKASDDIFTQHIITISEKKTLYTSDIRLGYISELKGNSLEIINPRVRVAAGEKICFVEGKLREKANKRGSGFERHISCCIGIPYTPFSITYTYDEDQLVSDDSFNSFFKSTSQKTGYAVQAELAWSNGYYIDEPSSQLYIVDINSMLLNSNNLPPCTSITVEYEYQVASCCHYDSHTTPYYLKKIYRRDILRMYV